MRIMRPQANKKLLRRPLFPRKRDTVYSLRKLRKILKGFRHRGRESESEIRPKSDIVMDGEKSEHNNIMLQALSRLDYKQVLAIYLLLSYSEKDPDREHKNDIAIEQITGSGIPGPTRKYKTLLRRELVNRGLSGVLINLAE